MAVDQAIAAVNTILKRDFCLSDQTEICGVAEILSRDQERFPVDTSKSPANPILPEQNWPSKLFWVVDNIATNPFEGMGERRMAELLINTRLYFVANRAMLGNDCANTSMAAISSLIDALPVQGVQVNEEIQQIYATRIDATVGSGAIMSTLYGAGRFDDKLTDVFAVEIRLTLRAIICTGICGDKLPACPPFDDATVTDGANTILLGSGESYTCEPAIIQITWIFDIDFTNTSDVRHDVYFQTLEGRFTTTDAVIVGATNVTWERSGLPIVGVFGFNDGDTVTMIAEKDGVNTGSVTIVITVSPATVNKAVDPYQHCRWGNLQNVSLIDRWRYDHPVIVGNDGLATWQHSARSLQGFDFLMQSKHYWGQQVFQGLSYSAITFPANHFTRIQFCLSGINGVWQWYESGAFISQLPGSSQQGFIFELRPNDATGQVDVYYTNDNEATWIFWRSSVATYVPGVVWYVDIVCRASWQRLRNPMMRSNP